VFMAASRHPRRTDGDDRPVLPDVTEDERDVGWGDETYADRDSERRDERWYRRERPPHHE
jgi:hypothetical protein